MRRKSRSPCAQPGKYDAVTSIGRLQVLAQRIAAGRSLALDTETTGVDATTANLVGISLTDRTGEAWYIPVRAPAGRPTLPIESIVDCLGSFLGDDRTVKLGHNLKYDLKVLARAGLHVRGRYLTP